MKNCLFLLLGILCCGKLYAQEPCIEINDKAMDQATFDLIQKNKYVYHKTEYWNGQSLYGTSNNTKKINEQLADTQDKEIIHLLDKAKRNTRREYYCFAALPLGIAAAYCIHLNQGNAAVLKPAGAAFLLASVSCIIISPIANKAKANNYTKAVKLYNIRF